MATARRESLDAVARILGKERWELLDAKDRIYVARRCHLRLARAAKIDGVEARLVIAAAEGRT